MHGEVGFHWRPCFPGTQQYFAFLFEKNVVRVVIKMDAKLKLTPFSHKKLITYLKRNDGQYKVAYRTSALYKVICFAFNVIKSGCYTEILSEGL